jgi:cytidylate kinase
MVGTTPGDDVPPNGAADNVATSGPQRIQPVVTISASYGAGGSVIAPMLAERLHLPFVDRVLSAELSDEAGASVDGSMAACRSEEGLSGAEEAAGPGSRLFSYLARAASVGTVSAPPLDVDTDDDLRRRAEAGLGEIRAGGGGVILGRAAAVVLAWRPRTLHVRLDGPAARRDIVAARIDDVTAEHVAERRARTDRARELWVKRLYRADVTNPKWYHLWVDATVLTAVDTVDLIELALHRYLEATAPKGDGRSGC